MSSRYSEAKETMLDLIAHTYIFSNIYVHLPIFAFISMSTIKDNASLFYISILVALLICQDCQWQTIIVFFGMLKLRRSVESFQNKLLHVK